MSGQGECVAHRVHRLWDRASYPACGLVGNAFADSGQYDAWRPPDGPMFEHGVENDQQLAHGRGERQLGGFTAAAKTQIKSLECGIETHCRESGHVEHGPDLSASAPHCAFAAQGAAVAVEWCDPDQLGDLMPIELS